MDDTLNRLERLYLEVGPGLVAYFRGRPGLAAIAEDLVQETFVRAACNPEGLLRAVSARAYLFGIARHAGIDALRKLRPVEPLDGEEAAIVEKEDPRLERLREAIAGLPPIHREALELKLTHELSYEEIAAALGIPVGTVRSRLHHAVQRLREVLGAASADNPPAQT